MSRRRTTNILVASVLALVGLVIVGLLAFRVGSSSASDPTPEPSASASPTGPSSLTASEIYSTVLPSLVVIRTDGPGRADGTRPDRGLGTGVIVNAAGSILTAYHVVDDAESIEVEYADGTSSPAVIEFADPDNDIASLTPDRLPEVVVPAVLGGGVNVGSRVVAVGNPLGLLASTTEGVVSGLDRSINDGEDIALSGLIQFDAAVNPGSSGGPLLNDQGQVVGVVSSLADPSKNGYFIGIGFAVPIGTALGTTGEGEGPER